MRRLLIIPFALLIPFASAQDVEGGCIESSPCEFIVDVDETGFTVEQELNGTEGDWFVLNVFNIDDVSHTVTLAGHGISMQVESIEESYSEPFQLSAPGTYQLLDEPTGDVQFVQVDADDSANGSESDGVSHPADRTTPGWSVALVGCALLLLAASRRST